MFRVSTWVLLGIIAAGLFGWVLRGPTLEGPKVAGWTDLGTWGWSSGSVPPSKPPVTAKVVTEKVALPAVKSEKPAKAADLPKKEAKAKDAADWDTAPKAEMPAKVAEAPAANAPKAKDAAPWNLDDAKGVDIDLNIKMPWQKDTPAPAAKPAAAPAPSLVPAPVTEASTGVAHTSPWPIATEVPDWSKEMKVRMPAIAAESSDDWKVDETKAAKAKVAPEPVAAEALPWPIAEAPVKWNNIRMAVPAPEAVAVIAKALDWPIADAPVKWTNFRVAVAEPEPEPAAVSAKAIDWPIADAPVTWTNVRMAAAEPELSVGVPHPFPWPIAEASIQWTNVRLTESEPEPEPAPAVAEVETWEKPEQWKPPVVTEEARRAELTPEQVACEDELRRIYKSGVIRFKSASAVIDKSSTATLNALAAAAKGCAKAKIRVEGHTDAQGSNAYNQSLSEQRAQAIAAYLAGAGVDQGSVTAQGFGEERPVATNDTAAGMAQNRRIEFTVY